MREFKRVIKTDKNNYSHTIPDFLNLLLLNIERFVYAFSLNKNVISDFLSSLLSSGLTLLLIESVVRTICAPVRNVIQLFEIFKG